MVQIYDVETYPNAFCIGFENYENDERHLFEISPWKDESSDIRRFVAKVSFLVGYNNNSFDNPILNYIMQNQAVTAPELYEIAQMIIREQRQKPHSFAYKGFKRKYQFKPTSYRSIDLMTLHASKALRVSLKEMEVSMCWPKVQDLPYPFDKHLSKDEWEEVKKYNFNDIGATKEFCKRKDGDIALRIGIEEKFGLSCLSDDPVSVGVNLFANMYESQVGSSSFREGRTPRDEINLGECILDKVQFQSKEFNDLLTKLKATTIRETKGSLNYSVIYGGVQHDYGTGGIHSKDRPGIVKPPEGWIFMDADVGSLYPSLWIEYGWCPAHLDHDIFMPLYKQIRDDRLNIYKPKAKTDPEAALMADTYKLMLNGSYGNLINEYSWLYDPMVAMKITLNGQLLLSMLSEAFTDAGFVVDSLNTDGITCMFPADRLNDYYYICKNWEKHTGLLLEYAEYEKVIRRDVNAYLAVYKGGGVKEKGFFERQPKLGKGYDKPVVKKALYEYFINGKNIREFIESHKDIYDFCMMQKMGHQFKAVHNNVILQKTNRFYASKRDAYLYKLKPDGSKGHVLKDSGVTIMNDYAEGHRINYDYYVREAEKLRRLIEPAQLSLF